MNGNDFLDIQYHYSIMLWTVRPCSPVLPCSPILPLYCVLCTVTETFKASTLKFTPRIRC